MRFKEVPVCYTSMCEDTKHTIGITDTPSISSVVLLYEIIYLTNILELTLLLHRAYRRIV